VTAPPVADGTGSAYVRLEYRRQMEIAVVGATAVVRLDGDVVADARIAITALAPTIRRVPEAEAALTGTDGGRAAAEAAAAEAAAASAPITDVRGSDAYRRAMAAVMTRRAISAAVARARDGARAIPIPASPALHGAV
jgi:xanthine dehydrogenase FAD-binding subunit